MTAEIYPDLAVAILAGGESRRFGADKALIRLLPECPPLLSRTVATAAVLSDQVAVIGHRRYESLEFDVPVIPDDASNKGPLEGIATALRSLDRPRILVVACDMPCLSLPLLRWMIERRSNAEVTIPRTADGRWQTMHAIYRSSALPVIERSLASGNGSVRSILAAVSVDTISEEEVRTIDPELDSFFSMNTPEDLDRARRCAALSILDTNRRNSP